MAIVEVTERIKDIDGSIAEGAERRYARLFFVEVDSLADGPITVSLAPGIPRLFDPYIRGNEFDYSARCRSVDASPGDSPYIWEVRVQYSAKGLQRNSQQAQRDGATAAERAAAEDPLARRPIIRWGTNRYTRVLEKDFSATPKPVVNSAGQYFDPPIETENALPVLTITRNEPSFDSSRVLDYVDRVNSDAFLGAAAGKVVCRSITAENQFENELEYYAVTYEFEYNPEGWVLKILDQGRYKKVAGKLVPILDGEKNPMADPVLLDGNGLPLADNTPAVYLEYKQFRETAFGALNLP